MKLGWLKSRRLKRHIESINFPGYLKSYGDSGEYRALCWLKDYVQGRASSEPFDLAMSMLCRSHDGMTSSDCDYAWTLLKWY